MIFKSYIPSAVTSIRLIAAPIIFYSFLNYNFILAFAVLIIALFSDLMDGYLARKFNATSHLGAYLDVTADFTLIITCFLAFVLRGWYNPLILLIITVMFSLFIATSNLKKPVYDHVGKYLGSFLMGMIFLSFLIPNAILRQILSIIFVIFSLISISTRLLFLHNKNKSL
ncbi:MAG: CDP-alcohol phosphatidyltransferase family protein [Methanobacteriaceae archaeon]|jgi:CDP-diacylglycerol--glycerol-3-phosphate 3-phosphatidyltransferase/cardiolipin synthase|nr:MAG: CDP-alcohol phosphatidyltransferase [Methanobacterium sp. BRmetb2]MCC7557414.1 CDP-alcohol phosphatidyltransferase family protein [Methanobacteriaceae archaeon]